ncbi:MAG TPA: GDSL-type esterase/lipase family protein, partial [Polyangiaceae bacterium]
HIGSNTWNPAVMDPVECMKEVIARLRRAVPDVSVMVMTPPDWGEKGAKYTPRWLARAEKQLRQAADESGAAFFDFRSAMGGEGSMAKFLSMGLTQGDGVHFNARGGAFVGDRVVDALGRAFARWAEAHPKAGCD